MGERGRQLVYIVFLLKCKLILQENPGSQKCVQKHVVIAFENVITSCDNKCSTTYVAKQPRPLPVLSLNLALVAAPPINFELIFNVANRNHFQSIHVPQNLQQGRRKVFFLSLFLPCLSLFWVTLKHFCAVLNPQLYVLLPVSRKSGYLKQWVVQKPELIIVGYFHSQGM